MSVNGRWPSSDKGPEGTGTTGAISIIIQTEVSPGAGDRAQAVTYASFLMAFSDQLSRHGIREKKYWIPTKKVDSC